ncbi:hypothetical protein NBRC10512_001492 [Rhodotorula toruloides]|uniref:Uncharacterized protein n=1 Tax=Rhodotorula toruloides (strain NP11) TaxID=1130832 RepID=M7XYG0_RHOT1|nr:uncharacterized protein RHTO_03051 [Rhodotorula toruloides NP11]EMS25323.1 hypothetical protein RHTO_03051 [Rhodotorula toruloides NP11]
MENTASYAAYYHGQRNLSPHPSDPFNPLPTSTTPTDTPPLPTGAARPSYGYIPPSYSTYADQRQSYLGAEEEYPSRLGEAVQGPRGRLRREEGGFAAFWRTYKTRNQVRDLWAAWLAFMSIIALQAIAVLVMIALVYGTNTGDLSTADLIGNDPKLESVATYLGLFILAVLFEAGITLNSCSHKNIMTLAVLCLFNGAILIYSAVLPRQLANALSGSNADTPHVQHLTHIYAVVIPAVVGACTVAMTLMLWPLYAEFGWDTFKRIGADLAIRRAYLRYQVFVCLLKFTAFFVIGFELQFLILVTGTPTVEFVLTIVALPVTILALLAFAAVVRIENRPGIYASFVVIAAGIAYFIYKLQRIYGATSGRYSTATATLTIFSVVCIVLLVATFVMMGLCMRNFGKGLKERIPGYHLPFLSRSRQPESGRPLASQSSPQPPPLAAFEKPDSRRPGMPSGQSTSKYGGETDRMSID